MEVIEIAKQLGEALKASHEYLDYEEAKKICKEDINLGTKISEFKVQKSLLDSEEVKSEKDETLLDALNSRCEILYKEITSNETMQKYNKAEENFEMLVTAVNMTIGSYIGVNDYSTEKSENCDDGECTPDKCSGCNGCHH